MVAMVADAATNGGESRPAERAKESAGGESWVGVLNEGALDVDTLLEQLRTTGIGAVENIIDESFRQRLVSEADRRFSETSTAEVEVIGPYEVKQQFNACATFEESSNFMQLRKALHALLLAKLGPAKAASSFTGAEGRRTLPYTDEDLDFNYFELMRYPPGSCGISPHRDHAENINIVCVFCIGGHGIVYGCDDRAGSNPIKYPTYPGAVVFMRAPGFESFKAKDRPFHYVADIDTKRYSFAVRQVRKDRVPPGQ